MIKTEIFIENYSVDLIHDLDSEFTFNIDDVADFGSRNTSYSKTITINGTSNNNKLFGYIFNLSSENDYDSNQSNIGYNFNASVSAQCRIFIDKIQIFKGIIRLLEIVKTDENIEYHCSVFGDLGGFISKLGNNKLEDLDFSTYNRLWNSTNIVSSWDSIVGSGVYFPLIDFGNVSSNKIDFDFTAFRPAFYVREYLEKIITASGYTWDFPLLTSSIMNRLVIPNNQTTLYTTTTSTAFNASPTAATYNNIQFARYTISTLGSFSSNPNNDTFTFTPAVALNSNVLCTYSGQVNTLTTIPTTITFYLKKNSTIIAQQSIYTTFVPRPFNVTLSVDNVTFNQNDTLKLEISSNIIQIQQYGGSLKVSSTTPAKIPISYNDSLSMNDVIPKGIFQKDFFLSICKMFNLYVYDDIFDTKKINIKPYVDFYDGQTINWTNKIDRAKPMSIKPMSEINARYYQFKYKQDNDYYSENYKKKYNEGYGDYMFDTQFDFVTDTFTQEIIFASSVLYKANATDKTYPAIYKKSNNASSISATEDSMDSVIRIMQAKKLTGKTTWTMKNNGATLSTYTEYGYAGHLDDPDTPTNDINFGAPKELFITVTSYPTTNLFNAYYSDYMSEITDKDSRLLTCDVLLNQQDILNIDFSKLIYIDGVLFRLNAIKNYNPVTYQTSKAELLRVINKTFI